MDTLTRLTKACRELIAALVTLTIAMDGGDSGYVTMPIGDYRAIWRAVEAVTTACNRCENSIDGMTTREFTMTRLAKRLTDAVQDFLYYVEACEGVRERTMTIDADSFVDELDIAIDKRERALREFIHAG